MGILSESCAMKKDLIRYNYQDYERERERERESYYIYERIEGKEKIDINEFIVPRS